MTGCRGGSFLASFYFLEKDVQERDEVVKCVYEAGGGLPNTAANIGHGRSWTVWTGRVQWKLDYQPPTLTKCSFVFYDNW